jgi:hypothetical protein
MRRLLVLLSVAALLAGCTFPWGLRGPDAAKRGAEEYLVYSSVVRELLPGASALPVRRSTVSNQPYRFRERDPGKILASGEARLLEGGLWDDFLDVNGAPSLLAERFPPPLRVTLVKDDEGGGDLRLSWEGVSPATVEGGVVEFSRVGFSRDLDRAVVYVGIRGAGRTGEGDLLFLEKDKGGWRVVKKSFVWLS